MGSYYMAPNSTALLKTFNFIVDPAGKFWTNENRILGLVEGEGIQILAQVIVSTQYRTSTVGPTFAIATFCNNTSDCITYSNPPIISSGEIAFDLKDTDMNAVTMDTRTVCYNVIAKYVASDIPIYYFFAIKGFVMANFLDISIYTQGVTGQRF